MPFNFDERIARKNTNCIKYDFAKERNMPEDVLPLWVADMDFRAPKPVLHAISAAVSHGIFGYSETKEDYFLTLKQWFLKRHDWEIEKKWLVKCPGIVFAIAMAVRAFTRENEAVMIRPPVYYPFSQVVEKNHRRLITNPLVLKEGRYEIDFVDFEEKIKANHVKCFILCNPHNPVGRVWTKEALIRMGNICKKYDVVVISDEIHQDFIYSGHKHKVFASLQEDFKDFTVTCTAPSKTFNLAGLQISNIFIANATLRRRFRNEIDKSGYSQLNTLGLVACQAAYRDGEAWLEALKVYLQENLQFIRSFLQEKMPEVKLIEPEGTYLIWLDFRWFGWSEERLEQFIVEEAKLWLDKGTMFGMEGLGFQRINIACPRAILEQAMNQLYEAYQRIS